MSQEDEEAVIEIGTIENYINLNERKHLEEQTLYAFLDRPESLHLVVPLFIHPDVIEHIIDILDDTCGADIQKVIKEVIYLPLSLRMFLSIARKALRYRTCFDEILEGCLDMMSFLGDEIALIEENPHIYEDSDNVAKASAGYIEQMQIIVKEVCLDPTIELKKEFLMNVANDPNVPDEIQWIALCHPSYTNTKK